MGAINFLAAAFRALDVAKLEQREEDAPRIFMGIVRKGLFDFINQSQEERARASISGVRASIPNFFWVGHGVSYEDGHPNVSVGRIESLVRQTAGLVGGKEFFGRGRG